MNSFEDINDNENEKDEIEQNAAHQNKSKDTLIVDKDNKNNVIDIYDILQISDNPTIHKIASVKRIANISDEYIGELFSAFTGGENVITTKEGAINALKVVYEHLAKYISELPNGIVINIDTGEKDPQKSAEQEEQYGMNVSNTDLFGNKIITKEDFKILKKELQKEPDNINEKILKEKLLAGDSFYSKMIDKTSYDALKRIVNEYSIDRIEEILGNKNYLERKNLKVNVRIKNKAELEGMNKIYLLNEGSKQGRISKENFKQIYDTLPQSLKDKIENTDGNNINEKISNFSDDFREKRSQIRYFDKIIEINDGKIPFRVEKDSKASKENQAIILGVLLKAERCNDQKVIQMILEKYSDEINYEPREQFIKQLNNLKNNRFRIRKKYVDSPESIDEFIKDNFDYEDYEMLELFESIGKNLDDFGEENAELTQEEIDIKDRVFDESDKALKQKINKNFENIMESILTKVDDLSENESNGGRRGFIDVDLIKRYDTISNFDKTNRILNSICNTSIQKTFDIISIQTKRYNSRSHDLMKKAKFSNVVIQGIPNRKSLRLTSNSKKEFKTPEQLKAEKKAKMLGALAYFADKEKTEFLEEVCNSTGIDKNVELDDMDFRFKANGITSSLAYMFKKEFKDEFDDPSMPNFFLDIKKIKQMPKISEKEAMKIEETFNSRVFDTTNMTEYNKKTTAEYKLNGYINLFSKKEEDKEKIEMLVADEFKKSYKIIDSTTLRSIASMYPGKVDKWRDEAQLEETAKNFGIELIDKDKTPVEDSLIKDSELDNMPKKEMVTSAVDNKEKDNSQTPLEDEEFADYMEKNGTDLDSTATTYEVTNKDNNETAKIFADGENGVETGTVVIDGAIAESKEYTDEELKKFEKETQEEAYESNSTSNDRPVEPDKALITKDENNNSLKNIFNVLKDNFNKIKGIFVGKDKKEKENKEVNQVKEQNGQLDQFVNKSNAVNENSHSTMLDTITVSDEIKANLDRTSNEMRIKQQNSNNVKMIQPQVDKDNQSDRIE